MYLVKQSDTKADQTAKKEKLKVMSGSKNLWFENKFILDTKHIKKKI